MHNAVTVIQHTVSSAVGQSTSKQTGRLSPPDLCSWKMVYAQESFAGCQGEADEGGDGSLKVPQGRG